MALSAGSFLSYLGDRAFSIGKSGRIKIGFSEAQAKAARAGVKKIACEEHTDTQDLKNFNKRLRFMDAAGIDMEVVRCSCDVGDIRRTNDILVEVVYKKIHGKIRWILHPSMAGPGCSLR